jgi:hypothetical protein
VPIAVVCNHNTSIHRIPRRRERSQLSRGLDVLASRLIVPQAGVELDNGTGMSRDQDKCLKHFLQSDGIGRPPQNDGSCYGLIPRACVTSLPF